jgi:hypothetical protein
LTLIIDPCGVIRCLYDEAIELMALGSAHIQRASHVEPDEDGRWWADLSPVDGPPDLGPFELRSQALAAEQNWIEGNALYRRDGES